MRAVAVAVCLGSLLAAATPELERARKLYNYTDYDGSLRILLPLAQKDAQTMQLIGRDYYMSGDFKKATEWLEKAVAAEPGSAAHAMWLGRAYGRRAETSSPFTAPIFASRARQNFERSVQLDPKNLEAINDLFEYYLEAPGFLGGGYDKAARLAQRIAGINAVEGHWATARLAEQRKEYGHAEENLRRATEMAPQSVGRLIDLAKFLAKHGRVQEAEQNLQRAETIAPDSPKLIYARADFYIRQNRNLDAARTLLRRYLNAQLTPDDPPRYEAEKLLRQLGG
ncbi:MAG: tetratricopeptide repeat protein [Acidobacteria bacterium]|nr:tetratricopeptide repeat protein [Acidobacteriota bacterium]